MDARPGKVLVGLGAADERAALRFAATEARRREYGVHVVHALHPGLGPEGDVVDLEIVRGELRRAGEDLVTQAVHLVRQEMGEADLPVTSEVLHGRVVSVLSEASARAGLVVVQRRNRGLASHLPTMSTSNGVAARSLAPVVVVPHDWEADDDTAPVVVGVDGAADSTEVIRVGMEEARLRGARLQLVLGWWYTDGYDDLVFPGPVAAAESARRRAELVDQVAPLLEGQPDLALDVVVVHRRPADLLVDAAGAAQLVVVGRHHPTRPWGSHLGPVARTVLREATAPVMVVDPVPQEHSRSRARHRARHRAAALGG